MTILIACFLIVFMMLGLLLQLAAYDVFRSRNLEGYDPAKCISVAFMFQVAAIIVYCISLNIILS